MVDWIGRTLSKVRIELLLARGGMAEVYLGMHTTLQRPAAVKLLRQQYQDDPGMLDRFQREARVVARLRHPNIVQVFDFDTVNGQPYLVMEYVAGLALSTYLRALHARGQRLELPVVSQLLTILAGALQYAHEMGVIHRDVKPGNILLASRNAPVDREKPLPADVQAYLTDFGLVRFLNSTHQTTAGEIAGTPAYMSPEGARGEQADERTDVYSLGVVLYEILAGRVPFDADSAMGILLQHINEPPPPIPGLSPALQEVIDCALAKDPQDRYQTPTDLAQAFDAALREPVQGKPSLPGEFFAADAKKFIANRVREVQRLPIFLGIGVVAVTAAIFLLSPGRPAQPAIPTGVPTTPDEPVHSGETAIPVTGVEATPSPQEEQTLALLRFQNGAAILDQVTLASLSMPPPAGRTHYEAWLLGEGGEARRSLGILLLDEFGQGQLGFVDEQGRNLVELYDTLEITLEPDPDPNPNPTRNVAYRVTLPQDGLLHVRHLLVAFGATPNRIGLIHGLLADTVLLDQLAGKMLTAYETGNAVAVRRDTESMLNLIVGSRSLDYRDWDEDGSLVDPGDGFGLLLNGDNAGYIEGSFSHAGYAVTAENTTANMLVHGVHVEVATQNMEGWTPELRDLLKQILSGPVDSQLEPRIRKAVALSDKLLNGIDLNGNEQIEPIPGEGGARTAYQHAYYMADIAVYAAGQ
jgi:serine/threonine protein kinase